MVARPGGSAACQHAALPDRHGSVRRRASSQSQTASAWPRLRLMPAKYVRPYSKGQKNDFRDAEAIAEAVQRPTMRFVATKTADQLDLQALHRVRERLVGTEDRCCSPCRGCNVHTTCRRAWESPGCRESASEQFWLAWGTVANDTECAGTPVYGTKLNASLETPFQSV